MSQLSRGIFGAFAVLVTCGAVQFASGRDLSSVLQNSPGPREPSIREASINRDAKADRAGRIGGSAAQTRTISLRLEGLSDTSVVIRIPVARETRDNSPAPSVIKSGTRKLTVACEPVVSVLTEVAKQLQPGRCVT
jgi:hypothetical protein